MTQRIDNKQWVAQNGHLLNPRDPDKTFQLVTIGGIHPNFGCYDLRFLDSKQVLALKSESLEELAKYADAVTVCCVEELGNRADLTDESCPSNETSIGNVAFVALRHSKETVRQHYQKIITKWKLS